MAAVAFASRITFSPFPLPRLSAHIYSSLIFSFSPAFIQLSIPPPPNSSQSLHPFTVLPTLLTLLLTSMKYNLPHLSLFQSSSSLTKSESGLTALWLCRICCPFTFHFPWWHLISQLSWEQAGLWEEAQHGGIVFGDNRRPLSGLQREGPIGVSGRKIDAGEKV